MKYYSEELKKTFDTVEELEAEEAANKKKQALAEQDTKERAEAARQITALYNDYRAAQKAANDRYEKYKKALELFIDKFGSYHITYTGADTALSALMKRLFDDLWY